MANCVQCCPPGSQRQPFGVGILFQAQAQLQQRVTNLERKIAGLPGFNQPQQTLEPAHEYGTNKFLGNFVLSSSTTP